VKTIEETSAKKRVERRRGATNRQIINVLQKRPTTPTLKTHVISYLEKETKSFEYTLTVMSTLEKQVKGEIERLGGNTKLEGIVEHLHVDTDST